MFVQACLIPFPRSVQHQQDLFGDQTMLDRVSSLSFTNWIRQVEWISGSKGTGNFKIERTCSARPIWNYEHVYSPIILYSANNYLFSALRWETPWPTDQCSWLRIERSWFEPWPDTLCCVPWTSHFTLIVPLLTQVYELVPWNLMFGLGEGVILFWTSIPSKERRMLHKPVPTQLPLHACHITVRASVASVPRRSTNIAATKYLKHLSMSFAIVKKSYLSRAPTPWVQELSSRRKLYN